MSSSSFYIFWKIFSVLLCLNVFGFLANFKLGLLADFLNIQAMLLCNICLAIQLSLC